MPVALGRTAPPTESTRRTGQRVAGSAQPGGTYLGVGRAFLVVGGLLGTRGRVLVRSRSRKDYAVLVVDGTTLAMAGAERRLGSTHSEAMGRRKRRARGSQRGAEGARGAVSGRESRNGREWSTAGLY
jgi:hypothetical protein